MSWRKVLTSELLDLPEVGLLLQVTADEMVLQQLGFSAEEAQEMAGDTVVVMKVETDRLSGGILTVMNGHGSTSNTYYFPLEDWGDFLEVVA